MSGRSGFVDSDGVSLHHLEYGAGDPIVVVPGITSPAITWEFMAEELADDRRVIVLDVRGRGESDYPPSGFTLPDYARDVAAVIDALDLARPALLGHSMGARIAGAVGVLHPDRAGPIAMVDPPMTGPGREPYPTSLETFVEQLEMARAGATADDMRAYFPTWTEEHLALRAEQLRYCDETAVRESWQNFHREDFLPYLRDMPAPALFMYGGDSPVVTPDAAAEVEATNPELELVRIPGAGHMIPWDNGPDFLAQTRGFLGRVRAA
jgi:N-formylmaleamate deformylase